MLCTYTFIGEIINCKTLTASFVFICAEFLLGHNLLVVMSESKRPKTTRRLKVLVAVEPYSNRSINLSHRSSGEKYWCKCFTIKGKSTIISGLEKAVHAGEIVFIFINFFT